MVIQLVLSGGLIVIMPFATFTLGADAEKFVEKVCNFPDECKEGIFTVADMRTHFKQHFAAKVADAVPFIINMPIGLITQFFVAENELFAIVAVNAFRITHS